MPQLDKPRSATPPPLFTGTQYLQMDPPADNEQNSYKPSKTGQSSPTLTVNMSRVSGRGKLTAYVPGYTYISADTSLPPPGSPV